MVILLPLTFVEIQKKIERAIQSQSTFKSTQQPPQAPNADSSPDFEKKKLQIFRLRVPKYKLHPKKRCLPKHRVIPLKNRFDFFLCPQGTVFATDDVTALVFLMVKVASLKKHLV